MPRRIPYLRTTRGVMIMQSFLFAVELGTVPHETRTKHTTHTQEQKKTAALTRVTRAKPKGRKHIQFNTISCTWKRVGVCSGKAPRLERTGALPLGSLRGSSASKVTAEKTEQSKREGRLMGTFKSKGKEDAQA